MTVTATASPVMMRAQWVCTGCDVLVRNSGGMIPEPTGWHDGLCVRCLRDRARLQSKNGGGDAAMAVLRYELLKGTTLKKAARRAGVPEAAARAVRSAMIREGEIDGLTATTTGSASAPGTPKRGSSSAQTERREAVEAALRENPDDHDDDIAARIGCSESTVKRRRQALGIRHPPRRKPDSTAGDMDLLRKLGTVTAMEFAAAIDRSYASARVRLRALVSHGLAVAEGEATKSSPQKFRAL